MIKILFCLRKRAELTVEEFQKHWYEVHAPLVKKHQKALRIARYVQALETLGRDPSARAASLELKEDEMRFIDTTRSPIWTGTERPII